MKIFKKEEKKMSKCKGEECIYGVIVCCRDCQDKTTCREVCDGIDEQGCDAACPEREEDGEDQNL